MEASHLQHQVMATHSLEEVLDCSKTQQPRQEKRLRPQPEQALRCPRCDSLNTKFCYYNNYSLSQPRYFCKGCRRYWTKGGSLRNVPVGGGCRKNKRLSSSSSKKSQDQALVTTNSSTLLSTLPPPPPPQPLAYDPNDLSLAFARLQKPPTATQLGLDDHDHLILGNPNPNTVSTSAPAFLDILRSGFLDTSTNVFHNLYYGFGGNLNVGEVGGGGEEVVLPFDEMGGATSSVKQESCKSMDGTDNKGLMDLQWQLGGDVNLVMDSGRDYWNNGVGSSWHGLVNSSLM